MTLRGGYNQFRDDDIVATAFDPAALGFNPAFMNAMQFRKLPRINSSDFGEANAAVLAGPTDPGDIKWFSWGFNGTASRLIGRHTITFGGDFQKLGLDTTPFGQSSGEFTFSRGFTQLNPTTAIGGSDLASLLLGFHESGFVPIVSTTNVFVRYAAGYIQDDFRVTPRFTLNSGHENAEVPRLRHDTGLGRFRADHAAVGLHADHPAHVPVLFGTGLPVHPAWGRRGTGNGSSASGDSRAERGMVAAVAGASTHTSQPWRRCPRRASGKRTASP